MKFLKYQRRELKAIFKELQGLYVIKKYINSEESFDELSLHEESQSIIWQFWEPVEGVSDRNIPSQIIKQCISSVERYRYQKYEHRILSLSDVSDFVDIPNFVYEKLKNKSPGFSLTAFSDILRLFLLLKYGGIWVDASILALDNFPEKYLNFANKDGNGFSFCRSELEDLETRKKWRALGPGYFSWNKFSQVNWLNSFIIAGSNRKLIKEILRVLLLIWKYEKEYPHYFSSQIIYCYLTKRKNFHPFESLSDVPPHFLQFKFQEEFKQEYIDYLRKNCPIQKLTWKYSKPIKVNSYLEWILKI